ncbi:uncharacterized protein LOC135476156 [Liolophura sinensis]|uniref:uncharacterized protein LOC135476156 n=1 Tax=Liolophura sinensis TaxID=3198878 RepID=UPI00315922EF
MISYFHLRLLLFGHFCLQACAIDCFVCSSVDGTNKDCEDTFTRTLATAQFIQRECTYGFFKATHCIKLKGKREDGSTLIVRQCGERDWGRHCGDIQYVDGMGTERIYGCLETCDMDGCNHGVKMAASMILLLLCVLYGISGMYC